MPLLTSLSFELSFVRELSSFPQVGPMTPTAKAPRKVFSPSEDVLLSRLVSIHGTNKWDVIATFMNGRSARQCRERWRTTLSPGLVNGPWSHSEDILLTQLFYEHGPKWSLIAKRFHGRSDSNVKNRWVRHLLTMNPEPPIPEIQLEVPWLTDSFGFDIPADW
jgi:hypothetical protein